MDIPASELLRRKVCALLAARGWNQAQLVECLRLKGFRRSQAWVSRKLTGVQKFGIGDLDLLVAVFDVSLPELFFDEYGQWDRRSKSDRRKTDRRQSQQAIFDPKVEVSAPGLGRLAFPDKKDY